MIRKKGVKEIQTQVLIGDPKIKPKRINKAKLLKKLKKQLWDLCKQYVRKRDGDKCFTCGKTGLSGGNQHTGHCIPSCLCPFELDYWWGNLAVQCYFCNIHAGGNQAVFLEKLRVQRGQEHINTLFAMKNLPTIIKPSIEDYEECIEKYKKLIKELK